MLREQIHQNRHDLATNDRILTNIHAKLANVALLLLTVAVNLLKRTLRPLQHLHLHAAVASETLDRNNIRPRPTSPEEHFIQIYRMAVKGLNLIKNKEIRKSC